MDDEHQLCPRCGSHEVDTVVYGMPTYPLQPGTVTGGCLITPYGLDRICRNCEHAWQTPNSARARAWDESTD